MVIQDIHIVIYVYVAEHLLLPTPDSHVFFSPFSTFDTMCLVTRTVKKSFIFFFVPFHQTRGGPAIHFLETPMAKTTVPIHITMMKNTCSCHDTYLIPEKHIRICSTMKTKGQLPGSQEARLQGKNSSQLKNDYVTEMCSGSRGGLVFKAYKLLYHSTLGLRIIKKKKSRNTTLRAGYGPQGS